MANASESSETPTEPPAESDDTAPAFTIGDVVHDREDDNPNDAIVVNLPRKPASEWTAYREVTVAEDNPAYPADARVIVTVFADALRESFPDWDRSSHLALTRIDESDATHYSFPAPRLTVVDSSTPASDGSSSADVSTEEDTAVDQESSATKREEGPPADPAPDSDSTNDDVPVSDNTPITDDDLSVSMRALKDRLEESMTVEIEPDGQALSVTKLGDNYRVRPGEVIEGEGALRSRLASIVAEYE